MNASTRLVITCAVTGLLLFAGGCSDKNINPYSSQPQTNMPEGKSIDYSTTQGTITEEIGPSEESLDSAGRNGETIGSFSINNDQNSEEYKLTYGRSSIQMQPIYFNFDQSIIRDDQISRMEHNAGYLKSNPASNVVIEGNSDERGTNEYNLALGERRAQVAKNYLIELGIEEYRIRTVSYGEERPLFTGQTESDYIQNRRDDFIIE
ncbi:peptidoglycan-associated lipoprotein Pal [Desulfogranum marinum]|jgi:peptidoglycan-associated lipoprotein|uniref:peptidoglycan-associated lipoprotein Pal n=1 Tax=Desulfogranum marinum TaxID=453220 RepID=UPI001E33DB88|nr:peptidoglycan-associated lipoprotein Pal [Desulfogranum marinum]